MQGRPRRGRGVEPPPRRMRAMSRATEERDSMAQDFCWLPRTFLLFALFAF